MTEQTQHGSSGEQNSPSGEEGIVSGTPREILETLIEKRVGVGILAPTDLPEIERALADAGFDASDGPPGSSSVSAGDEVRPGTVHRHGDGGIIVHQTITGSGPANFYWPKADIKGYDEGFYFDPNEDEVVASATGVRINPQVVVMFPTSTWHQFGADPNTKRESTFRGFYPK